MSNKLYDQVTDRIIAQLEAGTAPWRKSWSTTTVSAPLARPLRSNSVAYTGVNVINLWIAASLKGYSARHWFTYKGAQELGGQVRKGEKSELAFYVGKHSVEDERMPDKTRQVSFLRAYPVFNADQCEGLPDTFRVTAPAVPHAPRHQRDATVDAWIDATGAVIGHGGDKAYYMPSADRVQMPMLDAFGSAEAYYATLLHELTHWTGHEARCARDFSKSKRWGDEYYAVEELVAELGAAFLCADLTVSSEPRADHASYLASWLRVLKADNRAIFTAASAAEKAAAYLHQATQGEARAAAA